MNKMIAGLFAAALTASVAMAGSEKDLKKVVEEGPYLETSQKGITLSGYVDAGYQYNFNGRGENMATSPRFGNGTAGDDKSRGDFDLNAIKIALEKPLTNANELQAGFRVDAMMGEDAAVLGNNGGGSDSIFLEQAYVQFRAPVGNGIDFKVGKFTTILGYEVVERPVNMNITYSNVFNMCIPVWHTGVLSSYKIDDVFDVKFGVVNGSNNDNGLGSGIADNGAVVQNDDAALLAALNIAPVSNLNWYQAVMYGINGGNLHASDDRAMVVYDTYINWKPKFAKDKLLLGADFNLGNAPLQNAGLDIPAGTTTWWGWAAYTKYKFNSIFSLANRVEYMHNDDSNAFGNGPVPSREDIWSETVTASFDVIENMMLRTEYRLDWGKDYMTTSGLSTDGPLHTAVAEVVYSF